MPLVWRLAQPQFADELDGEGARLFGGRWNSRGQSALYTASHLSLAVFEVYVNIPQEVRDDLPVLQAVRIAVPDDAAATHVSPEQLAGFMAKSDPVASSRRAGDGWLDQNDTLVLEVPSIVVPEESNFILNPAHPRMQDVKIVSSRRFQFDPRLGFRKA